MAARVNPRRQKRPRSCYRYDGTAKAVYPSRSAALSALRADVGNEYRRRNLNTYWCERCEGWHLGHDRRKDQPA